MLDLIDNEVIELEARGVILLKPDLQSKSVVIDQVPKIIEADEGVYGLNKVTIESVSSSVDKNLSPLNIRRGIEILGVTGNLEPDKPNQTKTATPTIEGETVRADEGFELEAVEIEPVTNEIDSAIIPENIKKDITILGVAGTYEVKGDYDIESELKEDGTQALHITDGTPKPDMLQQRVDATNNCAYLFYQYGGSNVDYISNLDTSNVVNMRNMFNQCGNILTVPYFNTSKVTNMSNMFANCYLLRSVPLFDTSSVTNMSYMFSDCGNNLTTIHLFDTSSVTNMSYMFNNCKALTTVEGLDLISATYTANMFYNCKVLTNLTLKNINRSLTIGLGTTYGHLLTLESLLNTFKECWDMTSSTQKTLIIGTANMDKIANVYVKLVEITDEMRAEDPYIDNKKPFEVVDSTTEGAMTINDYMSSKNWALA